MQKTEKWYRERYADLYAPLSDKEKNAIRTDYEALFSTKWEDSFSAGCPNCYRDAIILISLKMGQINNDSGGYVLKRGVVFKYKGKNVTHLNITADAAEWYIKQDIRNRDKFEQLGRDYDSFEEQDVNP